MIYESDLRKNNLSSLTLKENFQGDPPNFFYQKSHNFRSKKIEIS